MPHFNPTSIILEGVTGSTAYGLATETSDVDKHGVYQAPTREVLGLFPPQETVTTNDPDITYHELSKFIRLAAKANPTVLEILYLDTYTESLLIVLIAQSLLPRSKPNAAAMRAIEAD